MLLYTHFINFLLILQKILKIGTTTLHLSMLGTLSKQNRFK